MSQNSGGSKIRGALAVVGAIVLIIVIKVGIRVIGHLFGLIGLAVVLLIAVGAYFALKKKSETATTTAPVYTPAPSPYDANTPAQGYPAPQGFLPPPTGAPDRGYLPPPSGAAVPGYAAPPTYPPSANTVPSHGHPAPGYAPAPQPNYPAPQSQPRYPVPNQPGYGAQPPNPYAPQGYPAQQGGYQQQGYQPQQGYPQPAPPNYPQQQR
ncbi:hypothetical protein [Nocardia sp. CDC160]|uniref:hypothetical protein n=1 Tax=Nocardia sp. CDC160 TaxID=3112166 RepID=UPI002DBAC9B7|nr:hypothetical protein [Nocardia sp. CDC160]MEC3913794.1 hypothetical protein [Nocardia sp. CDC160]